MKRQISLGPGCMPTATLPADAAEAIVVIGKEALSNADRHARGRRVTAMLERIEAGVRLRVEDDGLGLDDKTLLELLDRPGHLGLRRMRGIAQAQGGSCRFTMSEGGGLRIDAILPALVAE